MRAPNHSATVVDVRELGHYEMLSSSGFCNRTSTICQSMSCTHMITQSRSSGIYWLQTHRIILYNVPVVGSVVIVVARIFMW